MDRGRRLVHSRLALHKLQKMIEELMPAIYLYPHKVTAEEIDGQGHVNNLEYLKWMQTAAVDHSSAQGWPPTRYRDIGAGWVARSHNITYLKPAFVNDEIVVQTWVADFKKITSLRKYRIVRPADEAVLAVAETDWVFVGLEKRIPKRIPAELTKAFEVIVPAAAFETGREGE